MIKKTEPAGSVFLSAIWAIDAHFNQGLSTVWPPM